MSARFAAKVPTRFTLVVLMGGRLMHMIPRIDEVLTMLERFALGEATMSERRVRVALRLLDIALDDAPPPDDGDEAQVLADADQVVLAFPSKVAA
jgi:hypothetical protein